MLGQDFNLYMKKWKLYPRSLFKTVYISDLKKQQAFPTE